MVLGAAAALTGCGWILGLDEFTDQPPPGEAPECTSPGDCPTGEHGSASCDAGVCGFACDDDFADCDETLGCETSIAQDKTNCGGCGVTCVAYCQASSCNDPVYVAAMRRHTCAILKDRSVWCWGANYGGFLGDGTTVDKLTPARVLLSGPAVQVAGAAGFEADHTCALLADQTVSCWGYNQFGALGDGSTDASAVPVAALINNAIKIGARDNSTCAVTTDHKLYCWGNIVPGGALSPTEVAPSASAIAMGGGHACLITDAGALQCWGLNSSGQLGVGSLDNQATPMTVTGMADVVEVACGGTHTCARNDVGAYCWGSSSNGQLGLGDLTSYSVPQPLDLPTVESFALGFRHSSAIVGGDVYMWGGNGGALGDGTAVDKLSPTSIGLTDIKMTSLGWSHSCAVTDAGVLLCWGDNTSGQLVPGEKTGKPRKQSEKRSRAG